MTRQQRRSKSQWIRQLKRMDYKYFGGRIWKKFKWVLTVVLEDDDAE